MITPLLEMISRKNCVRKHVLLHEIWKNRTNFSLNPESATCFPALHSGDKPMDVHHLNPLFSVHNQWHKVIGSAKKKMINSTVGVRSGSAGFIHHLGMKIIQTHAQYIPKCYDNIIHNWVLWYENYPKSQGLSSYSLLQQNGRLRDAALLKTHPSRIYMADVISMDSMISSSIKLNESEAKIDPYRPTKTMISTGSWISQPICLSLGIIIACFFRLLIIGLRTWNDMKL